MKFGVGLRLCHMLPTLEDLKHYRVRSTFKCLRFNPYGCFDSRRHLIHLIADGYGIITLVLNSINDNQLPVRAQHRGYLFVQHLWFIYGVIVCRSRRINNGKTSLVWSLCRHFFITWLPLCMIILLPPCRVYRGLVWVCSWRILFMRALVFISCVFC